MRATNRRHPISLRAALLLLWVALLGVAITAVFLEGHALAGQPPVEPQRGAIPSATAAIPTGRRWFFDRSLWQQDTPQP